MGKYALVYGGVAGVVSIVSIIISMAVSGGQHAAGSLWLGYLIMIVALALIFVGVKRYRDKQLGGVIKFLPAFGLGLSMAVVAGLAYVAIWEVYLAVTGGSFIENYAASAIEAKKAAGVAGEALDRFVAQMTMMVENYANPLFRLPMTFIEIFPVGLVVSLVSAAILRNPKAFPARG
ncbi:MAG: DUF4199 domain-containing protein [Parvularculaceae bacterium]